MKYNFTIPRTIIYTLIMMGLLMGAGLKVGWGQVVISQVYGGGGNSGAPYTHDFVELFNRGEITVDLNGWSIQYASATGTSWSVTNLNGTIAPGQYYLIQLAGGSVGSPLPTPDATGSSNLSATVGKVALIDNNTALTGSCPTSTGIIDFVGFGSTANCYEGSGPTVAPSNTNAAIRIKKGCVDTDDNAADFVTGSPVPRNSSSEHDCNPSIVISQVYGGGGNSGAPYTNDFVELFNRGAMNVDINGWSIQYASATGTSWSVTNLNGTIAPGQYYLIQLAGGSVGSPLPTPDATGTSNLSATAGKVALIDNNTALTGSCPTSTGIIDFVGFGTTANCFEGSGPTVAASNTLAVLRDSNGCTDTDNNAADFTAAAPNPRISSSPQYLCPLDPVVSPYFNPPGGIYITAQSVEIQTLTDGATIYYTLNGNDPDEQSHVYTDPISVSSNTTIKARAYKNGMDPSAVSSVNYIFPTDVPNIATLRAGSINGTPYRLTGEAVVTFLTADRNAKYIQDETGAILIDDNTNVVTSTYDLYDGVENLVGTLGTFRSMLQFRPLLDPGDPISKGNIITPTVITLNELNELNDSYQAKLVTVNNVTIDADGKFAVSTDYDLSSPAGAGVLRTAYSDLNYINEDIPAVPQNLTGVILRFDDIMQLVPRTLDDFEDYVAPSLVRNPASLTGFKYIADYGPSASKSFSLIGLYLEPAVGTITVTGSVNFEVSADNVAFGETATFDYTGSTLSATVVYVRLKAGLSTGDYIDQLIIASGGGADSMEVTVGGEVIDVPTGLPYSQNFEAFISPVSLPEEFAMDATGSATNKLDYSPWANGGNNNTGIKYSTANASVLGYQHTTNTGLFTANLTLMNSMGSVIEELKISYLGMVARTDQGRSPEWSVKVNGTEVPDLAYSTDDGVDKLVSTTLQGLNIAPNSIITVEWSSDRGDGSGSSRQIGISNVVINLIDDPIFSLAEGSYYEEQTVLISNYNDFSSDVEIRYTADGSTPDGGSLLYNHVDGIVLGEGMGEITLQAIAIDTEKGFESFTVQANYNMGSIIPVANIAELRTLYSAPSGKSGPVVYQLTNEVFLTLQSSLRGQKYIQDATGAIMVDDEFGVITSIYDMYDGITGLTGTLFNDLGMIQLHPVLDPGPASSGPNPPSVVDVEVKTLSSITSADQAKLLKVLSVSFIQTGNFPALATWDIPISDPSDNGTGIFLIQYSDASFNYMGQPIPQVPKHIVAVMNESNEVYRLISRDLADFSNPVIAAINPAGVVGVPFGTSEAVALALMPPTTTMLDDGGAPYLVTLTWTHIDNYDPDKMGNYQAFATFDLPDGVVQSDPETDLIAQGTVAVSAPIPLARWGIYLSMVAMALTAGYLVRKNMF